MAGKGAPVGNQYNAKGKLVTDAIRKAIVQDKGKKLHKGVAALMDAFAEGQPWAVEQVMNRLEGKPAQGVIVEGNPDGAPIQNRIIVEFAR